MQQPPNVPRQSANWPDADLPPEDDSGIARLQQQYRRAQLGEQPTQGGNSAQMPPRQPNPGQPFSASQPVPGLERPSYAPLQPQDANPLQQRQMPPRQDSMMPLRQGGMPPQQPQMPPRQGGMPPQQGQMPPRQGGMPPRQGGMPPQQGQMPPRQGGMPPQQGGMPPQQGQMSPQASYAAADAAPMQAPRYNYVAEQPAELIPPSMQQQPDARPGTRINLGSVATGPGWLTYALLLFLGTGFGLLWAYVISPPVFVGANANRLNETSQDQWVQMVAVAYVRNGYDDVNASILLSQVDNPGAIVDRLLSNPSLQQPDRVALETIRPLAMQIQGTASPQPVGMPVEAVEVVIPLVVAAVVGLLLAFISQLLRRRTAAA